MGKEQSDEYVRSLRHTQRGQNASCLKMLKLLILDDSKQP